MHGSLALRPESSDGDRERLLLLRDLLERMQVARSGSFEFDAAIVDAFGGLPGLGPDLAEASRLAPGPHCSTVLMDVMGLLPPDYNFSIGRRDGVCWAWIQPNDHWRPGDGEARHDHPGGSGLAVADTPVLAVACAAIRLHIRLIEHRQRFALHRLIYVSRSMLANPEGDLRSILTTSRRNNTHGGITAVLLLFDDDIFIQVLEGAFTRVDAAFSRIRNDSRHADLHLLQSKPIRARRNPGLAMGLATNCGRSPQLANVPTMAAEAVLDLLLQLEYRHKCWDWAD